MSNQRGFIGLLGLLVAAAIIVFLSVKILTKLYRQSLSSENPSAPSQARSLIDSAEEAKRLIEQKSLGL